jgi:flavorubredoxin
MAVGTGVGTFNFNQYLVAADEPMLFHTGPRYLFQAVRAAVARVMPVEKLRYIGFSHFESDECGSANLWLQAAPASVLLCSRLNALVNADAWDRAPKPVEDGELVDLGSHRVRWFDTPHLPHGWESGCFNEEVTRTLLCGDLFTQGGRGDVALTTGDILGPSEAFRRSGMDYFSGTKHARKMLERLASTEPKTLACMHGSAWEGDGAALLRALGDALES